MLFINGFSFSLGFYCIFVPRSTWKGDLWNRQIANTLLDPAVALDWTSWPKHPWSWQIVFYRFARPSVCILPGVVRSDLCRTEKNWTFLSECQETVRTWYVQVENSSCLMISFSSFDCLEVCVWSGSFSLWPVSLGAGKRVTLKYCMSMRIFIQHSFLLWENGWFFLMSELGMVVYFWHAELWFVRPECLFCVHSCLTETLFVIEVRMSVYSGWYCFHL